MLACLPTQAPAQLQSCVDAMEACHLKPREVAMKAGEACDYMYVVHSGRVALLPEAGVGVGVGVGGGGRGRAGGMHGTREKVCGPGDAFGETSLMHGGGVQSMAVAQGMTQLWRLHRLAFKLLQMERGMQVLPHPSPLHPPTLLSPPAFIQVLLTRPCGCSYPPPSPCRRRTTSRA